MVHREIGCESCKYYEAYHKYPNPNAVARHYCTKCHDEIRIYRTPFSAIPTVWYPKACYFNNYFEPIPTKETPITYIGSFADQVED